MHTIRFQVVSQIPVSPTEVGSEVWGVEREEKGKFPGQKGKREKCGPHFGPRTPLGNQTEHTRERNETKRFPGWAHQKPPICNREIQEVEVSTTCGISDQPVTWCGWWSGAGVGVGMLRGAGDSFT